MSFQYQISQFQNPKMAIIRLLKQQGCCNSSQVNQNYCQGNLRHQRLNMDRYQRENDIKLLKYKEQMQNKFNNQKFKISQIPCVLTLAEQIEQLTEVINGLGHQNKERISLLNRLKGNSYYQQYQKQQRQQNQEFVNIERQKNTQQADLLQNQKLQSEYTNLLRALELTNQKNQGLISKLTNL